MKKFFFLGAAFVAMQGAGSVEAQAQGLFINPYPLQSESASSATPGQQNAAREIESPAEMPSQEKLSSPSETQFQFIETQSGSTAGTMDKFSAPRVQAAELPAQKSADFFREMARQQSGETRASEDPVPLTKQPKSLSPGYPQAASYNSTPPQNYVPQVSPQIVMPSEKNWRAFQGSDLREVLSFWSENAGIELIWASDVQYTILNTMQIEGGYERAVQNVLEQFGEEFYRPVGTLHVDKATGARTLVVQSEARG